MRMVAGVAWLLLLGAATVQAQGVSFNSSTGELWIWGGGNNDAISCSGDKENLSVNINGNQYGPYDVGDTVVEVNLGAGDDWFSYDPGTVEPEDQPMFYVQGAAGNDTIITGDRNDTVYGGDGNDTISTNGGVDYVMGGAHGDTIMTGEGADSAYGGTGWDVLWQGGALDYDEDEFEEVHLGG